MVNQYVIVKEIGFGATATVHKCYVKGHPDKFYAMKKVKRAIKRILGPPGRMKKPPVDGLFFLYIFRSLILISETNREIAIMKKIDHLYILKLYEVIDDPKQRVLYLSMNVL